MNAIEFQEYYTNKINKEHNLELNSWDISSVELMEAYHLHRLESVTDGEIENVFPISDKSPDEIYQYEHVLGATTLRDHLIQQANQS